MIIITGAAGFIGSNLLAYMDFKSEKVVGVDNLSAGKISNIKEYLKKKNFVFKKVDILSKKFLGMNIGKIDVIFHLASLTNARESMHAPRKYFLSIVGGTLNILELARKNDAKIVFTSSAAVYGDYKRKVSEKDRPKPISPYGFFKLKAEELIKKYHEIYGIDYTILRLFNVYGKNASEGIVKKLIDAIHSGEKVTIFGGTQKRDFVFVEDVVKIMKFHRKLNNDVFNVGTGKAISINQLIKLIEKIGKEKISVKYTEKQKGDIEYSCANIKKLLSKIKFKFLDLEEGLRRLI